MLLLLRKDCCEDARKTWQSGENVALHPTLLQISLPNPVLCCLQGDHTVCRWEVVVKALSLSSKCCTVLHPTTTPVCFIKVTL